MDYIYVKNIYILRSALVQMLIIKFSGYCFSDKPAKAADSTKILRDTEKQR